MAKRTKLRDRILPDYTRGEEIMNMVTHIVGGGIGVVATVLCVIVGILRQNVWGIVTGAVYGATMILLYTFSSIYHGLHTGTAKKVFQIIDHCTIFLLIAGTYTPISLCSLREYSAWLGWIIFSVVWAVAILGIVLNAIDLKKYKIFSMICYLAMGWCIIVAIKQTFVAIGLAGCLWLIAGGVLYTIGAVLYGFGKKVRYFHSVFHIFVVLGTTAQLICILFYVI